jgi:hypothetical protein
MKTDNFCKENRPEAKKKLRLPDQLELVMEDGSEDRLKELIPDHLPEEIRKAYENAHC